MNPSLELFALIIEADDGELVAIGSFRSREVAREWEDENWHRLGGTVRGVARLVTFADEVGLIPVTVITDEGKAALYLADARGHLHGTGHGIYSAAGKRQREIEAERRAEQEKDSRRG